MKRLSSRSIKVIEVGTNWNPYGTSYSWLIVTNILSCTVSELSQLIGQILHQSVSRKECSWYKFWWKSGKKEKKEENSHIVIVWFNVELNTFLRMFTQPMNAAKEPVFPTTAWLVPANQITKYNNNHSATQRTKATNNPRRSYWRFSPFST